MGLSLSDLLYYQDNYLKLQFIQQHRKDIIPFAGAGVSIECGLYSWGDLLDAIAKDYLTSREIELFHKEKNYFKYADKIVEVTKNTHLVMKKIRDLFETTPIKLTKTPLILVSSFSDLIVTTNYDMVLEKAAQNHPEIKPLKPLLPCLKGQVDEAIQINDRCLLKLHGSVEETSSFILTSAQYDEYYGSKGFYEKKPLPTYLQKLFSGKKILFVGCSLEFDRTLEILCECVKRYEHVSHYAILPWSEDEEKQIQRARQLTQIGIEPIYYPEGDFEAVGKLLSYLAEDNSFFKVCQNTIINKIVTDDIEHMESDALYGILKQAFYETAAGIPELLNDFYSPGDIEFSEFIKSKLFIHMDDTIYGLLLQLFDAYVDLGRFSGKDIIKYKFKEAFSNIALKERSIMEILKRRWSLMRIFDKEYRGDIEWIEHLPQQEMDRYANDLIRKLQYKNGMSFADIHPAYKQAKQLENAVGPKIESKVRKRLLNSIGAFSYYFNDSYNGKKYLERVIELIKESPENDRAEMLFLAKCYYNLALALACIKDNSGALKAIAEDMRIKLEFGENPQLYARSCDFYATLLKERYPFKAVEVYLDAARIKEQYVRSLYTDVREQIDMIGSWATALFNIGLLARDLELLEISYIYISKANDIRFQILDPCNKDYCNSLNVQAELELIFNGNDKAESVVAIIEQKQNLPEGFSQVMGHTWYVCALYYFLRKDYVTALSYANRSMDDLAKDAILDTMQTLKSKMLFAVALDKINNEGNTFGKCSSVEIFKEVIEELSQGYGKNSVFLSAPYRYLMINSQDKFDKKLYSEKYQKTIALYLTQKNHAIQLLTNYLEEIQNFTFTEK